MANILFVKLVPYAEEIIGEYQGGSWRGISTVDQIFTETNIGKILGTEYRCTSTIYWFSSSLWQCVEKGTMESNAYITFPQKIVKLCRILNNEIYAKIKIGKNLPSEFKVNKSLRQGVAVVPVPFDEVLETAIRRSRVETQRTIFDKCRSICITGWTDKLDGIRNKFKKK